MSLERIKKIRDLIIETKYVSLNDLVTRFDVSESTVRRDLQQLEEEGILKRNYGGAILVEEGQNSEESSEFRLPIKLKNYELKKAIGLQAAKLVQDGDFIAIGSGTTCLVFARFLTEKKNLTILTNNIFVAAELGQYNNIQVVITSGIATYSNNCSNAIGDYALNFFNQFHPEKAFCSVLGAELHSGYFDLDFKLLSILEKMIDVSARSYLLLDHTKFNKKGRVRIGELNCYNEIITTPGIPKEYLKYYDDASIPVHISAIEY